MSIIWAELVLAAVAIILFSRVKIRVTYCQDNEDDKLTIILSALFGLINLKVEYNLMRLVLNKNADISVRSETKTTMFEYFEKYRVAKNRYHRVIKYIKNRVTINKLEWDTVLGTGDAAITGIIIGILWNVKALVSFVLNSMFRLKSILDFSIIPCFDGTVFSTRIDCILSIKIGHAIIAGVIGLIDKQRDGDTFERASNRGINENHYGKHKGNG